MASLSGRNEMASEKASSYLRTGPTYTFTLFTVNIILIWPYFPFKQVNPCSCTNTVMRAFFP